MTQISLTMLRCGPLFAFWDLKCLQCDSGSQSQRMGKHNINFQGKNQREIAIICSLSSSTIQNCYLSSLLCYL